MLLVSFVKDEPKCSALGHAVSVYSTHVPGPRIAQPGLLPTFLTELFNAN